MTTPTSAPAEPGRLLDNLAGHTPGVMHAVVVSPDGLMAAASADVPRDQADQLAAIASGLCGLTRGAADLLEAGGVSQHVVEMDGGYLFLMPLHNGGVLVTQATSGCDVGQVGYQAALHAEQITATLNPAGPSARPAAGEGG